MRIITISSKRQITIPKDFLAGVGLEMQKKAVLEKEKDGLLIKPLGDSVSRRLAGSLGLSVPRSKLGSSLLEIDKETKVKTAKKLAAR